MSKTGRLTRFQRVGLDRSPLYKYTQNFSYVLFGGRRSLKDSYRSDLGCGGPFPFSESPISTPPFGTSSAALTYVPGLGTVATETKGSGGLVGEGSPTGPGRSRPVLKEDTLPSYGDCPTYTGGRQREKTVTSGSVLFVIKEGGRLEVRSD